MSHTIKQGIINGINDDQIGRFIDLDGDVLDYDDSTLPTREIVLSIGDPVIGSYDNSGEVLENILLLKPIYKTIADNLTEDSFTTAKVKCQLQIAQCCAVDKINRYIINQADGKRCEKDFDEAELMFNMIDSLRGFVPEGDLLSGNQATYEIIVSSSAGAKVVNISIGDTHYTFTSNTGNAIDFATDIAFNINLLYPQSYPYYALSSGINVVISGITFNRENGTVVVGSTTNGTLTLSPPGYLFGGIAPTYQGENCLTNQEAQIILNKLKSLCGC